MPKSNEPARCIRLEIPGEGHFDITRDVAELWQRQIREQLKMLNPPDDEDGELSLDEEYSTPLVGMD